MSTEFTKIPTIRAEKSGNKNKDDLRVMLAGVMLCVLLIFGQTAYQRFYDAFIAERPFIAADTLEIVYVGEGLEPLIRYDADPNQNVSGTWIASVFSEDGTRLASRRGQGNYTYNPDDVAKFWSWSAWFDNEESDPPAMPTKPFYICVRYVVEANDSGVDDSTERFCSNVYDPENPGTTIAEYIEDEVIR